MSFQEGQADNSVAQMDAMLKSMVNSVWNSEQPQTQQSMDSITLGQLKSMVTSVPKPKQYYYSFMYEDEDTVLNEFEEFYSYVEIPQLAENLRAWQGVFPGEWIKSSTAERKAHVQVFLESLEHRDAEVRFKNARCLLYVLQGTFGETTSPEHQLHWTIENCKVVRSADGLSYVVDALKIASSKHDLLSNLSETDIRNFNISASEKQELLEEVGTEVAVYLTMLYYLVEVFKGDDEFGEELMTLEPPLPIYLFNLVASLKDKSARGYPVKKLLLVLWKTMLTCFGGVRELNRAKKMSRELASLPDLYEKTPPIKSSPIDLQAFRSETTMKYPTFAPPASSGVSVDELAAAVAPIPVRHHYHHYNAPGQIPNNQDPNMIKQAMSQQGPLPPTPAPSPPPQAKPKKQMYQTDQTRPFLFPFSRSRTSKRLVPFAIDEADKLYARHMHIPLSLFQMWKTREECILDESGLEAMPGSSTIFGTDSVISKISSSDRKTSIHSDKTAVDEEDESTLPDVQKLDSEISRLDALIHSMELGDDRQARRRARERLDDIRRLRRVETLYSGTLPILQNWVVVLLKLLLATVSATSVNPNSAQAQGFAPTMNDPPPPPPTLEELDVMRHREITTKAVSAILLLTIKWFKTSHVMKFHHLGQLLVDTNCLLLILKMFGMQEVSQTVIAKNDAPDYNFFRYCYVNFSKNVQHSRPEDLLNAPRRPVLLPSNFGLPPGGDDEIELLSDYSWRNFFSSINFVKIMQKLSKQRSHRIWLLVQYKSSAILKRVLKVSHPLLQLYVLKLIKSQVPFCGRKWRQSNMKVITSIYLNCRPDLRDEWLSGTEVEDVTEALTQEHALRTLVKFYNSKRYGAAAQPSLSHRRSVSQTMPIVEGQDPAMISRAALSPQIDPDVFPPLRSHASDPAVFSPYIPEDIAFEEEYEDYLSEVGEGDTSVGSLGDVVGPPVSTGAAPSNEERGSAWRRLADFAGEVGDGISDSESIVSIGDLGDESKYEPPADENLNNWEHMSPKTLSAMPKSPAGGGGARRSSSGSSSLRPVLPFGLDDGSAVEEEEGEELGMGPMPTGRTAPFAAGEGGKGVDEVEFMYGE